jgi:uncharacterized protein YjbI with pentapeptide repeats
MAKCEHHKICERDADETIGDGSCILHSINPLKDKKTFQEALDTHWKRFGFNFTQFVFPPGAVIPRFGHMTLLDAKFTGATFFGDVDFFADIFVGITDFSDAVFKGGAYFNTARFVPPTITDGLEPGYRSVVVFERANFEAEAYFQFAKFYERANFMFAQFVRGGDFRKAEFGDRVNFAGANFGGHEANFSHALFKDEAYFVRTQFPNGANFAHATFTACTSFFAARFNGSLSFWHAFLRGRTVFSPGEDEGDVPTILDGVTGDFRGVTIEPLDALVFRNADLTKFRFRGTDLREAEITDAKWPRIGDRQGVYDEIGPLKGKSGREWAHIERLYRELKQNFEDRRDYERARDFHYGEKEMRRMNPKTSWALWLWLTLYKLVSGYGEEWGRPLVCSGLLLLVSTLCYLQWGLLRFKDGGPLLDSTNLWEACIYGLKVMALLKPSNFEPACLGGDIVNTAQSIFGPILIGLFALALRQRLKR